MKPTVALLGTLLLTPFAALHAAELYVTTNGNDPNPGTIEERPQPRLVCDEEADKFLVGWAGIGWRSGVGGHAWVVWISPLSAENLAINSRSARDLPAGNAAGQARCRAGASLDAREPLAPALAFLSSFSHEMPNKKSLKNSDQHEFPLDATPMPGPAP